MVYSGVSYDANAKLVEALGHFAAFLLPVIVVFTVEEGLHVDYGRFSQLELFLILLAQFADINFCLLVCLR